MKKMKLAGFVLLVCLCFYSCKEKAEKWVLPESPDQVNGIWEGGDTVLLPKSMYTLSRNTSAYVTIAITCDVEKNEVVFAIKYDYSKWLQDALKSEGFEGTKKQDLWDELSKKFNGDKDILVDNYTITIRNIIDIYTFGQEWQPYINAEGKKIRVLSNLSNMLGLGAGTFFVLQKKDTAKILAAYKTPIDSGEQSEGSGVDKANIEIRETDDALNLNS